MADCAAVPTLQDRGMTACFPHKLWFRPANRLSRAGESNLWQISAGRRLWLSGVNAAFRRSANGLANAALNPKGNRLMTRLPFKSLTLFSAAMILSGSMAFAAVTAEGIAADLQAQGYTAIEIKRGPTQMKVEAVNGTRKVEVIYDIASGTILKQEAGLPEAGDDIRTGVRIRDRARDFVRVRTVSSSDDNASGNDDDDDDDDRGRGSDDGADHDSGDDHGGGSGDDDDGKDDDRDDSRDDDDDGDDDGDDDRDDRDDDHGDDDKGGKDRSGKGKD
jgi:hypothetical protein